MSNEVILGIITAILALVTIYQSYRSHRLSKLIASHQGAFKTPNLRISVYDPNFEDSEPVDYFILSCKLYKGRILVLPLLYVITNEGDKSATDVKLFLRYHKNLRGGLHGAEILYGGAESIKTEIMENSGYQTSLMQMGSIEPKLSIRITDLITISEATLIESDVDVTSKDGVPISISYEAIIFNVIDFTAYQKDESPISGRIKLLIVNTKDRSLKDILESYNKRRQEEFRRRIGNRFNQAIYFYKLKLKRQKVHKRIKLISYDESKIKKHPNSSIDEVLSAGLLGNDGIEDITGSIFIANVNL